MPARPPQQQSTPPAHHVLPPPQYPPLGQQPYLPGQQPYPSGQQPYRHDQQPYAPAVQNRPRAPGTLTSVLVPVTLTLALVVAMVVIALPARAETAVGRFLPSSAMTDFRTDLDGSSVWQLNQAVLPGDVGQSGLNLLAREQIEATTAERWLAVDAIGPRDQVQRTSLDFAVDADRVELQALGTNGWSVQFSPGLPVLDQQLIDGGSTSWTGRVSLDDGEPIIADATVTGSGGGTDCVTTAVEVDGDQHEFEWCAAAGLVGWNSTVAFSSIGFTVEQADPPSPVDDPVGLDEVTQSTLSGTEVRPIRFFRTVGGGYREEVSPDGSRSIWAGDQLVIADTSGRLTSWLPMDDAESTEPDFAGHLGFWRVTPGGSVRGLAAVGAVTVVGTTDRAVIAYDRDGRQLWRDTLDEAVTDIQTWGTLVVVADASGTISGYQAGDGARRWSYQGADEVLAVGGSNAATVVVRSDDKVRVLSAATGEPLWSTRFAGSALGVVVAEDTVVMRLDNWLLARNARTGAALWEQSTFDDDYLARIPAGLVVVGHRTSVLDLQGKEIWRAPADLPGAYPPAGTADELISEGTQQLALGGPSTPQSRWDYPAQLLAPELPPVRGDRGVITMQLTPAGFEWFEYR